MLTDSTSKTNIPMLRKPFSGVLPPHVPVVASDNLGGVTEVDGEAALKLVWVQGRTIKEIPSDFNLGSDEDGLIRCIYIKNGKIVQSNPIEQIQISPVGTGTVNIAKVSMPDGTSFYIKAPEGGGSGGGGGSGVTGNMPLLAPVWLDYICSTNNCIPAMENSPDNADVADPIMYSGKYLIDKYLNFGDDAAAYNYRCMYCNPLASAQSVNGTGDIEYLGVVSGYYNFRVNRAGRYVITSTSGRTSHHATSMSLIVTPNGGDPITHYTPAGQKAAFVNAQMYDLPANSTIRVSGSSSGGWANCNVRYAGPATETLYTKSGDEYIPVTTFNEDGSLTDGVIYYTNHGATHSQAVAYEDVFDHLLKDYNLAYSDGTKTDTYTKSNGATVDIRYYRAPDGHKICLTDQLSKLNELMADSSIGEAWYYVINPTTNQEAFYLPRTRHGFHGDRGYAKVGSGHTRMYLHFMVA